MLGKNLLWKPKGRVPLHPKRFGRMPPHGNRLGLRRVHCNREIRRFGHLTVGVRRPQLPQYRRVFHNPKKIKECRKYLSMYQSICIFTYIIVLTLINVFEELDFILMQTILTQLSLFRIHHQEHLCVCLFFSHNHYSIFTSVNVVL